MSRKKLSANISNFPQSFDINTISPNLRVYFNEIKNRMQHQFFFDRELTHEHLMFILNNGDTMENEFIQFLDDRIHEYDMPCDIREYLINNMIQFSTNFTHINIDSAISHHFHVDYYSDENDNDHGYDDTENLVLDQIEMEHDTAAAFHANQANKAERLDF